MTPDSYHEFYAALASVCGALIGLLFVAVSLAPERIVGSEATAVSKATAGLAFTTFTNALVVSLTALLPHASVGIAAIVVAASSISATLGLTLGLLRRRRTERPGMRWVVLSGLALALFVSELIAGIALDHSSTDTSALDALGILTIGLVVIGILRAWELMGAESSGVIGTLRRSLHAHREPDDRDEH